MLAYVAPVLKPYLVFLRLSRSSISRQIVRTASSASDNPRPEDILSKPTWSIDELLPDQHNTASDSLADEITPSKLRHLLRLSALPPPKDAAEERKMLDTLKAQLHFVRSVQSVDTTGVEPLTSIRDETPEAVAEAEITVEKIMPLIEAAKERNLRRKKRSATLQREKVPAEDWDVLGQAQRKQGRYFVVDAQSQAAD